MQLCAAIVTPCVCHTHLSTCPIVLPNRVGPGHLLSSTWGFGPSASTGHVFSPEIPIYMCSSHARTGFMNRLIIIHKFNGHRAMFNLLALSEMSKSSCVLGNVTLFFEESHKNTFNGSLNLIF